SRAAKHPTPAALRWYLPVLLALALCLVALLHGRRPAGAPPGESGPWDPSGSVARLENAVRARPRDAERHRALSRAYAGVSAFLDAADELRTAIDLGAGDAPARTLLGSYYRRLGDQPAAAREYAAALRIAPGDAQASLALAALHREAGR